MLRLPREGEKLDRSVVDHASTQLETAGETWKHRAHSIRGLRSECVDLHGKAVIVGDISTSLEVQPGARDGRVGGGIIGLEAGSQFRRARLLSIVARRCSVGARDRAADAGRGAERRRSLHQITPEPLDRGHGGGERKLSRWTAVP